MSGDPLPTMTVAELDAWCQREIEEAAARLTVYDEQSAIACDLWSTDQLAIAALQRPERFNGEHAVARRWLSDTQSHKGIFRRRNGDAM